MHCGVTLVAKDLIVGVLIARDLIVRVLRVLIVRVVGITATRWRRGKLCYLFQSHDHNNQSVKMLVEMSKLYYRS